MSIDAHSPCAGIHQPRTEPQHGRLACTARAHEGHHLARLRPQPCVADGPTLLPRVPKRDALKLKHTVHASTIELGRAGCALDGGCSVGELKVALGNGLCPRHASEKFSQLAEATAVGEEQGSISVELAHRQLSSGDKPTREAHQRHVREGIVDKVGQKSQGSLTEQGAPYDTQVSPDGSSILPHLCAFSASQLHSSGICNGLAGHCVHARQGIILHEPVSPHNSPSLPDQHPGKGERDDAHESQRQVLPSHQRQ
mmetsp:Transcript_15324/g.35870  ORF Transcript_15324/g.35870 Transcript_15324/m.35870 type:complete len:255 (+) Transcript_15324:579-1343(+)